MQSPSAGRWPTRRSSSRPHPYSQSFNASANAQSMTKETSVKQLGEHSTQYDVRLSRCGDIPLAVAIAGRFGQIDAATSTPPIGDKMYPCTLSVAEVLFATEEICAFVPA